MHNLRRLGLLLLAIGAVWISTTDARADDFNLEAGFVSMFNGKDFSGWQFDQTFALPKTLPKNWKVEDGVIKLSGGGSPHLGSQWAYEDFDMRFQWRAMREKYNSGFYIRSNRKVGNNQINLAKGGEGRFFGGKMNGGKPVPELQKPAMEWNDWRVLVAGEKVSFWCNGKLAWMGTEFQSKRGHIGLQAEGAPLEFRNFRIQEIGYTYLGDPAMWPGAAKAAALNMKDYVLRLEWKASKGAAGGIHLLGASNKTAIVQIGDFETGSGGLSALEAKPAKKNDNPLGQWNYMEIHVSGGKTTVSLNGVDVIKGVDLKSGDAAPHGINFDFKTNELQFQNVRVKAVNN